MQSLSDEERREVLGEVLIDELKAIREYVEDIPAIKRKLSDVDDGLVKVEERLIVVEKVVKNHEVDIRQIRLTLAC